MLEYVRFDGWVMLSEMSVGGDGVQLSFLEPSFTSFAP